jgi:quercetin dioxygenase-like cupin family protein
MSKSKILLQAGKEVLMKRNVVILITALAAGFAIGVIVNQFVFAQQPPLKSTILQKVDLTGIKGKEVVMLLVEIAPGGVTGVNYPAGDEFAYILEGSYVLEIEGKRPVTYKPGETFHVLPMQAHFARNPSTTAPVKVVVFLITNSGQPPRVPAK